MRNTVACVALSMLLLACNTSAGGGAGVGDDVQPDASVTEADAGADGAAETCSATSTAAPIVAPNEQWTWVPLDGMKCADGTSTGIGVNLTNRSDQVLVFFQGGGACWDAWTCFVLKTAAHIEGGYGASTFQSELATLSQSYLFQRDALNNPLRDISWIYVPYCTGDLHDGDRVATYDVFGPRTVHHVGSHNADVVLSRVAATRPESNPVWMMGLSAGGYGVGFNIAKARATWPCSNIRALADCSPSVPIEWQRYGSMKQEWSMKFPLACTDCATNLGALPAALRAEARPGDRYGLLAYTHDQVISIVLGVEAETLRNQTLAEQTAMAGSSSQAAFVLEGDTHVMLGNAATLQTSNGMALTTWIDQWATNDPAWANAGP
jgi:hypothetical protein